MHLIIVNVFEREGRHKYENLCIVPGKAYAHIPMKQQGMRFCYSSRKLININCLRQTDATGTWFETNTLSSDFQRKCYQW